MSKQRIRIAGKSHPFGATDEFKAWRHSVRPGGWIISESPMGERRRLMATEVRGKLSASMGGILFSGELQQERRHHGEAGGGGDSDLLAQFPGKVRKVLVEKGQQVKEGEPMVLVEAMKMEFTIKAPFPGIVQEVCVAPGQQLSPGDRFIDLKEQEGNGGA